MKTIHYYASPHPLEFENEQQNEIALTQSQLSEEDVRALISKYATRTPPYELIAPLSILHHYESWNIPKTTLFAMLMKDYENDVSPLATGTLTFHALPPEDTIEVVIHARRVIPFDESIICREVVATN